MKMIPCPEPGDRFLDRRDGATVVEQVVRAVDDVVPVYEWTEPPEPIIPRRWTVLYEGPLRDATGKMQYAAIQYDYTEHAWVWR